MPDIYNFGKDPSWSSAGAVGMDALMMLPAARGIGKFLGYVPKKLPGSPNAISSVDDAVSSADDVVTELRNELSEFDILAYPSTFEETSCISVIEALSTGLRVVTSSIGALPETTEGWARMYSYNDDREEHGKLFAKILGEEIEKMFSGELVEQLTSQRDIYSKKWSWDERIKDWEYLFNQINVNKNNYSTNSYNPIIS